MSRRVILLWLTMLAICPITLLANQFETPLCQECRTTVSYWRRFNSSETHNPYSIALNKFCQKFFSPSSDFVEGPCSIILALGQEALHRIDPVDHCDRIGACGRLISNQVSGQNKPNDMFCDICKSTIDKVKNALSDPKSIQKLRENLEAICDLLKVIDGAEECKAQIPPFISYVEKIVKSIDSKQYCEAVQLCSANQKDVTDIVRKQSLHLLANFGPVLGGQITSDDTSVSPTHHKKGPNCLLCKVLIKELNHLLKDNRTAENIEANLEKVCGVVFKNDKGKLDKCNKLVDKYSKKLIEILAEEMNPEMVCILLEQCIFESMDESSRVDNIVVETSPSHAIETVEDLFLSLDSSLVAGSYEVCIECKLFIKYLQEVMKNPSDIEKMKEFLKDNLCNHLDSDKKESCSKVIDKYAAEFFKAVAHNLNPSETCKNLGACKAKFQEIELMSNLAELISRGVFMKREETSKAPIIKTTICEQCVKVIQAIDEYISKEDVDNNVDAIIDKVCKKMDPSLAGKCTYIVELVGAQLIQAISNMENPTQLCTDIKLC